MKPGRFEYHAPTTIDDAVAVLGAHADDGKVLAGGQSLVPLLSLRLATFGHLVDLNRVGGLAGIERSDGHVRVGALTRQSVAEHDPTVAEGAPLVARALPHVGHLQIRNRGTIGGSIAHADPASELPAVALATNALIDVTGPGGDRTVEATTFFRGMWSTALGDDEILTAVRFPVWEAGSGFGVSEVARRHGDFALCGAVCAVTVVDRAVRRASIAMFGVADTPLRAPAAEAALVAGGVDADLGSIGREAADPLSPSDDHHASGDYRKRVAAVVVRRALTDAIQEATRG